MGLPITIQEVLGGKKVEWQRLELKAAFHAVDVLHTLCAFANDLHNMGGGYLVIGVGEENGQPLLPPCGLSQASLDDIQKKIRELGHKIVPEYHPLIEPCEVEGRFVLLIWAGGAADNRPYSAPKTLGAKGERDGELAYYIRRHSSTVEIKRNSPDWSELMELAAKVPFDDRLNHRAQSGRFGCQLNSVAICKRRAARFLAQMNTLSFEELLRKMHLVDGPAEFCVRATWA